MLPSGDVTWFDVLQRWRAVAIMGLFVGLIVLFYFSGPPRDRALTIFVLAPLMVGAFGVWRVTAWTALAALAVTTVVWALASPISGPAFAARLVVVGAGGAVATLGSWTRERQHERALEMAAEAQVASTFIGQLVPDVGSISGFDVVIAYESGAAGLQVGGDFIDVVELGDGSAAFIIGDVCGHGPEAAALGVAVRTAWRAIIRLLPTDPARWLEELEDAFSTDLRLRFVTASTGILEPSGHAAAISSAGHPYPIVLGSGPRLHRLENDPPLGLRGPLHPRQQHAIVLDGASLLVFTDGLWESRRLAADGTRAGIEVVEAATASLAPIHDAESLGRLVSHFRPPHGGFDDDVAALLIASTKRGG